VNARILLVLVALSSAACGDPADCTSLSDAAERDRCLAERAPLQFAEDPAAADAMVAAISDPNLRDLVNLNLTRDHAPTTDVRCRRIVDAQLRERCMAVVSRPHLHPFLGAETR
jgi:hypothetical protein